MNANGCTCPDLKELALTAANYGAHAIAHCPQHRATYADTVKPPIALNDNEALRNIIGRAFADTDNTNK